MGSVRMTGNPTTRKRRLSGQSSPSSDSLHHSAKRQKFSHPARRPPQFWDNLSKIDLEKSALEELDRRNTEVYQDLRRTEFNQARRPVTRAFLASIATLAKVGGPDISDLRGYNPPSRLQHMMSSRQSSSRGRKRGSRSSSKSKPMSNTTTTTKSTGPYDRPFQQHLIDHGIYPDGYEYPDGHSPPSPDNMEEIIQALARPRSSLSPSRFTDDDFRRFKRADTHASKERQVTTSVIPILEGDIGDSRCVAGEIPFTNLDHLTDGTLVPGNPDLYYGARPEQLDRQVRTELSGHIIPSTQHDLPILPNFFLAAKGPDGSLAVAGRQACYDGALGARGMQSLRSNGDLHAVGENQAHTITTTYHGGQLKMYTSHVVKPTITKSRLEITMTQINTWSLTGNAQTFRQGAAAFRNARDWAKQQRDQAIKEANNRKADEVKTNRVATSASLASSFASDATVDATEYTSQDVLTPRNHDSVAPSFCDSDTSADELSMSVTRPAKRPKQLRKNRTSIIIDQESDC